MKGGRLVLVLHGMGHGGVEQSILLLLESGRLRRLFDSIVVLTAFKHDFALEGRFAPCVDGAHHLGQFDLPPHLRLAAARELLSNLAPDVVFFAGTNLIELVPWIRRRHPGTLVCYNLSGVELNPIVRPYALMQPQVQAYVWLYRRLSHIAPGVDLFLAIAEGERQRLMDELHVPADRIALVRLGVDQSRFHPVRTRNRRTPRILWCARLDPVHKDPLLALKVADQFIRRHPRLPVEFEFIGDGPGRREFLRALAWSRLRTMACAGKLRYLGSRSDFDRLLSRASALMLTSRLEGIPLVVMEALSCGIPVVMPGENNFVSEISHHGWVRFVRSWRDVDSYCDCLELALDQGIPTASSPPTALSADRFSADAEAALRGLLSRRRRPAPKTGVG